LSPAAVAVEAVAPLPCHTAAVAAVLAADKPIDISWLAISVTQAAFAAITDAGEPASKVAAITSGGPVHLGSVMAFGYGAKLAARVASVAT
jgi:hypothetical protein